MPEKILIVDDDVETLRLIGLMLERQGFQVIAATNGQQALALAHTEHPEVILLDVMMPNMDGYEVTRQLRRAPDTSGTPILLFTAKSQVEDKVSGYDAGADDYLTKPVHPAELTAHIRSLLTRSKARTGTTGSLNQRGYLIGAIGIKGGVGTSSVVVNLATAYYIKRKVELIAAELRPGQGSWGLELGQTLTDGLTNLLKLPPAQITPEKVGNELVRMPSGVRMLLASNLPKDSNLMAANDQLMAVVNSLASLAQISFLDIGSTYMPVYEQILKLCHETLIVTEPFPSSVQRTRVLMDELIPQGFGKTKIMTVVLVNRVRSDMQLSITQVQELLNYPVAQLIPPAPELAYQAVVRNIPMIQVPSSGLLSQQYSRLAEIVAEHVGG